MADHISMRPAQGTWVVRAGGAVLGESDNALELIEDGHSAVVYFPREDIAMEFLDRSEKKTTCPYKGEASCYYIVTKSTTLKNSAWSYESPKPGFSDIKGHLAFQTGDLVAVEQL